MPTRRTAIPAFVALATACSSITQVETPELVRIVQRDGVAFPHVSIPPLLADRLGSYRVVVVGEAHFLQEHREFMGALVRSLHERGFRQLLMEWPHAYDWVLSDFVNDGGLVPAWEPPQYLGGVLIRAVRDFNRTLPADDRVRLGALDVNLDDYGGAESFITSLRWLAEHLDDPGPVGTFLGEAYGDAENQRRLLEILREGLVDNASLWRSAWGEDRHATVLEMIEVELASVPVRALREDRYEVSTRLRESAIQRIVDIRIGESSGGTLVNIGATHAQKSRLFGTKTRWLGDYLVHDSPVAEGSVFVLAAMPAWVQPASGGAAQNQLQASPENELFRLMHESWPDATVFLPLDDSVFSAGGVPLSFEETVHVCAPKRHYDGLVLLPLAHRDPLS